MQDLYIELQRKRKELKQAEEDAKRLGIEMAQAEKNYRKELAKMSLILRDKKIPISLINNVAKGKKEVADAIFEKEAKKVLYESAIERIQVAKLEIRVISRQMEAIRRGE